MTFPASTIYAATLIAGWSTPSAAGVNIDTNTLKAALYTDSMVQDPLSTTPQSYSATGELANGNGYTTTGLNMGTITYTVSTGVIVCSVGTDTTWPATTNFANVYGVVVYDPTATSPAATPCLVAVKFGAVGSSSGGSFTVDWAVDPVSSTANTIFTIDPRP